MNIERMNTDRLLLTAVAHTDLEELHALHADPKVWQHLPSGVHTSLQQTEDSLSKYRTDWQQQGLGYWTVRKRDSGSFVGIAGVRLNPHRVWNMYYRISPVHHGTGYATEVARHAVHTAHAAQQNTPIVALLLEHNEGSRR